MSKISLLLSIVWGTFALAHPQKMAIISGKDIHLQTIDHSFAGSIKNRIVSGFKKHGTFESELSILENDIKTTSIFKKNETNFGGTLVLNGKEISVEFVKWIKNINIFVFNFDGETYNVHVSAGLFENGHYVNPIFSIVFEGEMISFQIKNGQACPGYAIHLIAMIFPAYIF